MLFTDMKMRLILPLIALTGAFAQCPDSPAIAFPPDAALFSAQQERELGEIVVEFLGRGLRPLDDPRLTGRLQRISARIKPYLPPTEADFRFYLLDAPYANAFAIPGGRIYITRKTIGLARSEDEVAAVVAHEMGHVVARQAAGAIGRAMRVALNVKRLGDRQDIFDKFNRLIEEGRRHPIPRGDPEKDQQAADTIALHAFARAGYGVDAFPAVLDRLAETQGKTGNLLSDLIGLTPPEGKRIRDLAAVVRSLPAPCRSARSAESPAEFQQWQAQVAAYTEPIARKEGLPGIVRRVKLEPPLRADLTRLRFSPDGRLILAQDNSGISVLSREPFVVIGRIPSSGSGPAQFTLDSGSVVFLDPGLREEIWDATAAKRREVRDVPTVKGCISAVISPDASRLACQDNGRRVKLIDTSTGSVIFDEHLGTRNPTLAQWSHRFHMAFSPDGHYLVLGCPNQDWLGRPLLLDARSGRELPLPEPAKRALSGEVAFLSPDRVLAHNASNSTKSAIVSVPDGTVVQAYSLPKSSIEAASNPAYVLLRPFQYSATGILDVANRAVVKAHKGLAIDFYGDVFVAERATGELGLYGAAHNELRASVPLPVPLLSRPKAISVSPDLRWLAVSERSRGLAWDLTSGAFVFQLKDFDQVHVQDDGAAWLEIPERDEQQPRKLVRLDFRTKMAQSGQEIKSLFTTLEGPYLVTNRPAKGEAVGVGPGGVPVDMVFELRSLASSDPLWTRAFKSQAPSVWWSQDRKALVYGWPVSLHAASVEAKADSELADGWPKTVQRGGWLLELIDPHPGAVERRLVADGITILTHVLPVGDALVLAGDLNRVLVLDSKGGLRGRAFGDVLSTSPSLIAIQNEPGVIGVFDLQQVSLRKELKFDSPVVMARFSGDARQLLVITAAQEAILFDTSTF